MDCSDIHFFNDYYIKGEEYLLKEEYGGSLAVFDEALSQIGYTYLIKGVNDSTGQKLTLAKVFQKENKIEEAANMKKKILGSRVDMLKKI